MRWYFPSKVTTKISRREKVVSSPHIIKGINTEEVFGLFEQKKLAEAGVVRHLSHTSRSKRASRAGAVGFTPRSPCIKPLSPFFKSVSLKKRRIQRKERGREGKETASVMPSLVMRKQVPPSSILDRFSC